MLLIELRSSEKCYHIIYADGETACGNPEN